MNFNLVESPVVHAKNDYRYNFRCNFTKQDVNAKFIEKHGLNMTIKEFKQSLQHIPCQFKALYGNALKRMGRAEVYNIETVKQYMEEEEHEQTA